MTPDTKPSSPNPTTLTSLDKLLSQEAEQKIHPPLYRILTGEFKSRVDAVRVTVVDTKRVLSQEATEFIENEWAKISESVKYPNDVRPSRVRLEDYDLTPDGITLSTSITIPYSHSLVIRNSSPEFLKNFGSVALARDLAVTGISTLEGGMLIGLTHRLKTDYKNKGWGATVGGFVVGKLDDNGILQLGQKHIGQDGLPNPLTALFGETLGEFGSQPNEINKLGFIGITTAPFQGEHPNLIYSWNTNLNRKQLAERKISKEVKRIAIPNKADAVLTFVDRFAHAGVSASVAALRQFGAISWGQSWRSRLDLIIETKNREYTDKKAYNQAELRDIKSFQEELVKQTLVVPID